MLDDAIPDILEWDVHSWSPAVRCWGLHVRPTSGTRVLEVGSRRGGISLYFALCGSEFVICSDLHGSFRAARELHRRHGVDERTCYLAADATRLPLPDACLDVVACKSVLGGIGSYGRRDLIESAVAEAWRVLRPGGWFCFAENLRGAAWHRWCRRRFTDWGARWYYFDESELRLLLADFTEVEIATRGVFALLGRSETQRTILGYADDALRLMVPKGHHYLAYGVARRP